MLCQTPLLSPIFSPPLTRWTKWPKARGQDNKGPFVVLCVKGGRNIEEDRQICHNVGGYVTTIILDEQSTHKERSDETIYLYCFWLGFLEEGNAMIRKLIHSHATFSMELSLIWPMELSLFWARSGKE